MGVRVVLCTDGSEVSIRSLKAGLSLFGGSADADIVTVIEPPDPTLVSGTGLAGGVMGAEEYEQSNRDRRDAAERVLADAAAALDLPDAARHVLEGSAGPELCDHAASTSAAAIVLGTRGLGGFRRAILGSVSDHVTRNAPCSVVITADPEG